MKKVLFTFVALVATMSMSAQVMKIYKGDSLVASYTAKKADKVVFEDVAQYVDLGLPSGLKWATCNVGATYPEEYGDYFAWGEIEPYYSSQDPLTWKTGKENGYKWQSYCGSSSFTEWSTAPYDATTKNLKPEFDAATANWGGSWRMPTKADFEELIANCTWTWTEDYDDTGIKGYIVTSKAEGNTNSIFFPAAGVRFGTSLGNVGSRGGYWSTLLNEDTSYHAYYLSLEHELDGYVGNDYNNRYQGRSIRPVCK